MGMDEKQKRLSLFFFLLLFEKVALMVQFYFGAFLPALLPPKPIMPGRTCLKRFPRQGLELQQAAEEICLLQFIV